MPLVTARYSCRKSKSTRAFRGHFLIYWGGDIMGQVNILNVLIALSNSNIIQVLLAYSHTLQHTEYYSNLASGMQNIVE